MKTNKQNLKKLFFSFLFVLCAGVFAIATICYSGGGGNSSQFSVNAAESEKVTAARQEMTEYFTPIVEQIDARQLEAEAIANSCTSIKTAFASDFAAWANADGSINSFNSPNDISGSGTEADPYIIKTVRGFMYFIRSNSVIETDTVTRTFNYQYVELGADLDFSGYLYDMFLGSGSSDYATMFVGVFDGKGHTIKNLTFPKGGWCTTLFASVGTVLNMQTGACTFFPQSTVIKNLNFEKVIMLQSHGSVVSMYTAYTDFENISVDCFYANGYKETLGASEQASSPPVMLAAFPMYNVNVSNSNFSWVGETVYGLFGASSELNTAFKNPDVADQGFSFSNVNVNMKVKSGTGFVAFVDRFSKETLNFNNCHASGDIAGLDSKYIEGAGFVILTEPGHGIETNFYYCTSRVNIAMPSSMAVGLTMIVETGTIENCANYGNIYSGFSSGIASYFLGSKMSNCVNYGKIVNLKSTGDNFTAGVVCLFGDLTQSGVEQQLSGCKNYGEIIAVTGYVGGIVAVTTDKANLVFLNCENYGNIYGGDCQGGIVGYSEATYLTMQNCNNYGSFNDIYVSSEISVSNACGIVYLQTGTNVLINNCNNFGNFYYHTLAEDQAAGRTKKVFVFSGGIAGIPSMSTSGGVTKITIERCSNFGNFYNSSSASGILYGYATRPNSAIEILNCNSFGSFIGSYISSSTTSWDGAPYYASIILLTGTGSSGSGGVGDVTIDGCVVEQNNRCDNSNLCYFSNIIVLTTGFLKIKNTTSIITFQNIVAEAGFVGECANLEVENCLFEWHGSNINIQEAIGLTFTSSVVKSYISFFDVTLTSGTSQVSKKYYHDDATTPFAGNIWVYSSYFGTDLPLLRKNLHVAPFFDEQNGIETYLSSVLGFVKEVTL